MKRTIVTLLAAMMCIALLAGCGGTATETPPEPSQAPETQTPQTQPPETPEPPQEDPVPAELDYAKQPLQDCRDCFSMGCECEIISSVYFGFKL